MRALRHDGDEAAHAFLRVLAQASTVEPDGASLWVPLRALPVTENEELVGMLTIEDVGQASLLRPLLL